MGTFVSNAFASSTSASNIMKNEILEISYLERINGFVLFCEVVLFE